MTDVTAPPHATALRMCWQKQQFDGPQDARSAALRINSGPNCRRKVSAYRCKLCRAWHIGGKA